MDIEEVQRLATLLEERRADDVDQRRYENASLGDRNRINARRRESQRKRHALQESEAEARASARRRRTEDEERARERQGGESPQHEEEDASQPPGSRF